MYGKMKDHLSKTLAEKREAGLNKEERPNERYKSASNQVTANEETN